MIDHFVRKKASEIPLEHKEEMQQEAFLRIFNTYERLDPERGWKSFVFKHCRGAVMDYQKFGKGFPENRWSLQKKSNKKKTPVRIFQRMDFDREDQNISMDSVMLEAGLFAFIDEHQIKINWDLVARMSSIDQFIHIFAKFCRGFEIMEIAYFFGISRTRVFQIIQSFIERFDNPELAEDPWFKQTCFAFGLCRRLGIKDVDQSKLYNIPIGWNEKPVDLDAKGQIKIAEFEQLSFFGDL